MLKWTIVRRFSVILLLGLIFIVCLSTPLIWAATVTWDPNGNLTDGGGTWDTSSTNWWNGSNDTSWTSGNTALFGFGAGGASPYNVNVSGVMTVGGIQFENQLYTLSGGTLAMNGSTSYLTPDFGAVSGVAGEIESAITKTTANSYISGGGTLVLGGSDNFSGQTLWLDNATLQVVGSANISMGGFGLVLGNNLANSNYVQTGGSVAVPSAYVGNAIGKTSSFTISGGTFNSSGTIYLADRANSMLNVNGGVLNIGGFSTGQYAAANGTINVSAGLFSFGGVSNLGSSNGVQGIFNISGGTATSSSWLMVSNGGVAATGVVNQTGGLMSLGGNGALVGWGNGADWGYGAYLLSAGTLNLTGGQISLANQNQTFALYGQSGGAAIVNGNLFTGYAASGLGTGVIDVSGGRLTHTAGFLMNTGGFGTAGNGILTVRGGGYLQDQTGNLLVVNNAAATGIVNVVSGGTLDVSRIYAQNGGASTINFDGGTLRAYNSANGPNFLTGLTNAFVYPGGLTFDTNGQNVTIGQVLTLPAGYGVGATGSTLTVANSGGSGYVAPPVVSFAAPAGGGVAATGVATINASGSVTGITITSPGSGYASGESVAVTFNGNNNKSGAAATPAATFNVNANTLNASGGLTVIGTGALALNGANTYTGATTINSGALYLNGAGNASTSISVASSATLGGIGSAPSAVASVAKGGTLDFSQNAGNTFTLAGLNFAGRATINVDALANYASSPVLIAGVLTPSSTAGSINIDANLGSTTVLSGTYDLIGYTGSIGGAGMSAFTISVNGLSTRQHASLINSSNQLDVVVTGATPYWSGNQTDWRATNAWTLQPGNTPTTFQTGDTDIFDDSAISGNVVINSGNVLPASVVFNNSSLPYTVNGNYGITGSASLSVNGAGTVTIANSNSYTGGTTLSNGLLNLSNSAAIGTGPLTLSGGTLDNTSGAAMVLAGNNPQNWNGDFIFVGSNNLNLGTGAVTLGSSRNVTVNANTLTVGGVISDGGKGYGFTLNGGGTLLLTGSSTYIGPTTISSGTLQLGDGTPGHDGSINGTSALSVAANAAMVYDLAGSQSVGYLLSGGGNTTISSGTLQLDLTRQTTNGYSIGNISVASGAALALYGANAGIDSPGTLMLGTLSGSGAIIKTGTGYLAFWNNGGGTWLSIQGFAGLIDVEQGTLANNNSDWNKSAGAMSLNIATGATFDERYNTNVVIDKLSGGGTLTHSYAGALAISVGNNNGSSTFSGVIQDGGGGGTLAFTQNGSGVIDLTGSNTYTGATTISAGTLEIGNGGATGSLSPSSAIVDNAALVFSRSDNISQGAHFSGNPITGSGSLIQLGPGVLSLNAANVYSGPTVISGGVLNAATLADVNTPSAIGQGSFGGSPADLVIDGGALQYTGAAAASTDRLFTVGLSGKAALDASGGPGGTMTIGSGGGAIAFANNSAPATLTLTGSGAGILGAGVGDSGTGPNVTSLVKAGTGTWILVGSNTYTGATSINGGALYLYGSNATKSISMAGGTTLGGTGSATSAVASVAKGGILDFSQNAGNTFALAGLTFAGQATINVDSLANYAAKPALNAGVLTPSSTAGSISIDANLGSATVLSGTYDLISYTGSIGGAGMPAFTISVNGLGSRQNASLISRSNQLDVVVTGATPYWSGKQADWRATNAWTLQPGNTPTTFQTGDTDIFDDSATSGSVAINIANVSPASAVFNNNSLAYKVNGSYGITGSASLSVTGAGAVTIANSNSYTGGTTLGNGLLNLSNSAAIGSGPLTLSGGTLDNTSGAGMLLAGNNPQNWNGDFTFVGSNNLNLGTGPVTLASNRNVTVNANTLTVGGVISGGGGLTLNGGGSLLLTASNSYSGPTAITGGTLQLGDGSPGHDGSINGTSGVTNNAAMVYNLAGSQTVTQPIGGSGSLTLLGSGTLTLLGSNSYSGGANVNGGTLQIGNGTVNGTIGSGTYNIAGGASLSLNYATAVPAGDGTWSNNISGAGTLRLNSSQAVNGSANWGPNTASATLFGPGFTGTLQIDNGRLDSSAAGLGGVSNIIINTNAQFLAWTDTYNVPITIAGNGWGEGGQPGALRAAGGAVTTWTGPITLSANAGISAQAGANFTLTGAITGNYQAEFETSTGGTGTINLTPSGTTQNSYGSMLVDGGATVIAGNQYAFSAGALSLDGGILELNGYNFSFANLSGRVGTIGNYASSSATLTIGAGNSSGVYGGTLVDGGGASLTLVKTGTGTLILSPIVGASTYTGGTIVEAGTLLVGADTGLPEGSSLTVGAGGISIFDRSQGAAPVISSGVAAASPVPEPGTLILLLAAILAGFGVWRRTKKEFEV
jgi:autotransporter-associated beta strand protein